MLPCDDGNLIDGDGCSSVCQVETNYFCYGGTTQSPDKCNSTLPLQFSSATYYVNQTISVVFNKPVFFKSKPVIFIAIDPNLDKLLDISIEGNIGQTFSFSWTYKQIGEKTLLIFMNFKSSLLGDEVISITKNFSICILLWSTKMI